MQFVVNTGQEDDGEWFAEVVGLPGVIVYGDSRDDAIAKAKALAFRVIADRLEHGELEATVTGVTFDAA